MAKRCMAKVMSQCDALCQILVELQCTCNGARDLSDFDRVGQTGAEQVTLVIDEYLCLVLQSAKGCRVDDAITVALELGAIGGAGSSNERPLDFSGWAA